MVYLLALQVLQGEIPNGTLGRLVTKLLATEEDYSGAIMEKENILGQRFI